MEYEDDPYELEADASYKETITPQELMEQNFNDIYKRDWKRYLQSIEWDTWCKPNDPISLKKRIEELEIKNHPFNTFF